MPHVIVHFDPRRIDQDIVDRLKKTLPFIVADALNFATREGQDAYTKPSDIYVRQAAAHPTDANPQAIEIEIQAGKKRDRSEIKVTTAIEDSVYESRTIPHPVLDAHECSLWLRFSEDNDFRAIRGSREREATKAFFHDVHP